GRPPRPCRFAPPGRARGAFSPDLTLASSASHDGPVALSPPARVGYLRGILLRYLARRLAAMVPLLVGTTLIVFVLGRLAPGDPVQLLFGDIRDPVTAAP